MNCRFIAMTIALCCLSAGALGSAAAGDQPQEQIIVATRQAKAVLQLPYTVYRIDQRQIQSRLYRTLPQALREVPSVMVQETAPGQGSPFIRGFTGFRTLYLIDGVRLNNSVFREGPNQYAATIEPGGIDGIEVMAGPGSTLYGSDAIGGTISVSTRNADRTGISASVRRGSAEHSTASRLAASVVDTGYGDFHLMATRRTYGDLRLGESLGTQRGVGHDEWSADLKWQLQTDGAWEFTALHQELQQDAVPRVHVTAIAKPFEGTSRGTDLRRELDQERRLSYVQAKGTALGAFDRATVTLSHVATNEGERRVRASGREDVTRFDVDTYGAQLELVRSRWVYGVEYYLDAVDTESNRSNIQGVVADNSSYGSFGAFVQREIELSDRAALIAGARHTRISLHAGRVQDPRSGTAVSIDEDFHATVGTLRGSYYWIPARLSTFAGVSQGFRAPSLSDVTRLDSARTGERETPASGLEPEHFTSLELGMKFAGEDVDAQVTYYRTLIDDLIQRFPTGRLVDGEVEISKRNVGEGHVEGLELSANWRLARGVSLFANLSWQDGEIARFGPAANTVAKDKTERIMPLTYSIGLNYSGGDRWWVRGELMHANDADDLSRFDALDTSRIPPGGTPGFTVLHVGGGLRWSDNLQVSVSIDNLTNADYRVHGSGTNMPGRNLIVEFEVSL